MIARRLRSRLLALLDEYPAVVLLGARQVGKTTLAHTIVAEKQAVYLDLESATDLAKLSDAKLYLSAHEQRLVVLDEIQRQPRLFEALRVLIDRGRRQGKGTGRFLLLGSGAMALLRQSSETLAGRVAYLELNPLDALEVSETQQLWLRGGMPKSFTSADDTKSLEQRRNFISACLERDVPQFGIRISTVALRRLWTMLAHLQGEPINAAMLARNLGISGRTATNWIDLLTNMLLLRRLAAWHGNVSKRLVKGAKVYVRDSGILHALLGLTTLEDVLGHPQVGKSWEGHVIENLLATAPPHTDATFYRSAGGAEIDLILSLSYRQCWAIEIKRSLAAKPSKGFHAACADIKPAKKFIVYPGQETYPLSHDTVAISLTALMQKLSGNRSLA